MNTEKRTDLPRPLYTQEEGGGGSGGGGVVATVGVTVLAGRLGVVPQWGEVRLLCVKELQRKRGTRCARSHRWLTIGTRNHSATAI